MRQLVSQVDGALVHVNGDCPLDPIADQVKALSPLLFPMLKSLTSSLLS